ncbi:right-handed parallel beta-helix repeat-containing protein [Simplicispira hankyongi]|uniref:Pectate lyase superfamily protein domain-containing protein n=1 Tax=Simplicispira hankyongi TaxID=2315688 RepID=A0A398CGF5_9BURK|nr:right-handed parallel beta-helix repeat-containing protein [Simplicispira hankyongi]RID99987.1 hypothetical protein D3F03_06335 [Simplicispira hankyongi]
MKILHTLLIVPLWSIALLANAGGQDSCTVKMAAKPMIDARAQGAAGDGITDDTKALQGAIDQASVAGGVVVVPDGVYLVDAVKGVRLKSDVVLKLSENAVIKAAPNGSTNYSILRIENASNVAIIGGVLLGERYQHQGTKGEWGMGVSLAAATNIIIKNVVSKDNWGDGFYIGGNSKDVSFCSVVADGNRRQGMSIISGENILVTGSSFINTKGTAPQAGIDIEPDAKEMVRGVKIVNSKFWNNSGAGIASYAAFGPAQVSIFDIEVNGNMVAENNNSGISIFNTSLFRIIGNTLRGNRGNAIFMDDKTRAGLVRGNRVFHKGIFNESRIVDNGMNAVSDNYFD